MALILTIENMPNLPDGGPVSITVSGRRNIDIGRDTHLDWTLPDPTRHISSKHCEVRYKDGGYWLHDVSTNGTLLNGADHRMQAPHRLRTGDRFVIGPYIINARLEGEEGIAPEGAAAARAPANYQEIWASDEEVAPPIDRSLLKVRKDSQRIDRDFLDWAADIPADPGTPSPPVPTSSQGGPSDDMSWASGPIARPAPSPEPPPMPTPRRPVWVTAEPEGPWSGGSPDRVAGEQPNVPAPSPAASAPRPAGASPSSIAVRLAQGARVPEEVFAGRDPDELTEMVGQLMRLVVESTMQLLNARLQAKRFARSASHTMIEALNNNPLKFSPSAEDAMRIMFGPATRSYLDAYSAFAQSFDDLKLHQLKTYSAMQHALTRLMQELDPQTIENESAADRGIAALVASRKARLWDAYVARWQALTRREDSGVIDAFMLHFAEFYDRGGNDGK